MFLLRITMYFVFLILPHPTKILFYPTNTFRSQMASVSQNEVYRTRNLTTFESKLSGAFGSIRYENNYFALLCRAFRRHLKMYKEIFVNAKLTSISM